DMHRAVARIYQALLSGEKIAIYGDFDADGITATALLVQGLSALGGKAIPYIPHRLTEGYGLRKAALENLHQQGNPYHWRPEVVKFPVPIPALWPELRW
ncbi:unnamed protein product, partial [marine sediment metagenome]